jgi:hypothetical protein
MRLVLTTVTIADLAYTCAPVRLCADLAAPRS